MKKLLAIIFLTFIYSNIAVAQTEKVRPTALGLSFILNDYKTPALIRSTSFGSVRNNDQWTPFKDQSPGLALTYFKGIKPRLDFAGTMAASFVRYAVSGKTSSSDRFLLEVDASGNFKLFPENFAVNPYLNVGVGASKYGIYWGAFMPLGLGLKVNLFNESDVFLNFQYRVPVTKETAGYHFMTGIGVTGLLGDAAQ